MKLLIRVLLLVSFASFAGPNALADLTDGLVAHYTFDGNANDATGNGHNGTVYGGAGYSAGISGSAIDLDGIDDYVRVADATDLRMEDNFSATAWVNPASLEQMVILNKAGGIGNPNSHAVNYAMYLDAGDAGAHFENPSDADWTIRSSGGVTSNTWQHVAFTKEGDSFTLYLNGTLADSASYSFTEASGTYDLSIGVFLYGNYGAGLVEFFEGQIDEVRIYDRALSSGEVGQLAVPEPATAVSLIVGSFIVVCYRRIGKVYGLMR